MKYLYCFCIFYIFLANVFSEGMPPQIHKNELRCNDVVIKYLISGKYSQDLSDIGVSFSQNDGSIIKKYTVKELIKNPQKIEYKKHPVSNEIFYYWLAVKSSLTNHAISGDQKTFTLVLCDKTTYVFDIKTGEIIRTFIDEKAMNSAEELISFCRVSKFNIGNTVIECTRFGKDINDFSDIGISFRKNDSAETKSYKVNDLVKDKSKIIVIQEHNTYHWMSDQKFSKEHPPLTHTLIVADGHVYVFDVSTGNIIKSYVDDTVKMRLPEYLQSITP